MGACTIDWDLVLSYLSLFLSWPAVSLYIFLILIWLFRREFAGLIKNFRGAKVAGVEVNFSAGQPDQGNVEPEVANIPMSALIEALRSERLLNSIYGSQLEFLRLVEQREDGATMAERDAFFATHRERFPGTRYTPNDWSAWLLQAQLVSIRGDAEPRFFLGDFAHVFLRHLRQFYEFGILPRFG